MKVEGLVSNWNNGTNIIINRGCDKYILPVFYVLNY